MVPHVIASIMGQLEREEEGQGLVEYGLIIVLVSIVSMVALGALGVSINSLFAQIEAVF